MTTSISRFYEFVDSMKSTIEKVNEDIEFNKLTRNMLLKENEEAKNEKVSEFINTLDDTTKNYEEQKKALEDKVEMAKKIIDTYEKDNKYEEFFDTLLNCFGFDKE